MKMPIFLVTIICYSIVSLAQIPVVHSEDSGFERVSPVPNAFNWSKFLVYRSVHSEHVEEVRDLINYDFEKHTQENSNALNTFIIVVQPTLEDFSQLILFKKNPKVQHGTDHRNLLGTLSASYSYYLEKMNSLVIGVPSVDLLPNRFQNFFLQPQPHIDFRGNLMSRGDAAIVLIDKDGRLFDRRDQHRAGMSSLDELVIANSLHLMKFFSANQPPVIGGLIPQY